MTDTLQCLTYDDFGHIIGNDRSGTAADMSYAYVNLHGWTTQIKSKGGFEQNLYRETEGKKPRWDGSISAMTWQTDEGSINSYDYEYDGLNRLTLADYTSKLIPVKQIVDFKDTPIDLIANQQYERNSIVTSAKLQALIPESEESLSDATLMTAQEEETAMSSSSRSSASTSGIIGQSKPGSATGIFNFSKINGNYTEAIAYDANTNIISLQRYGRKNDKKFGLIDDLSIKHNGNQISSVSGAVDENLDYEGAFDFVDGDFNNQEYAYNANGALTKDLNKNITRIEYDLLGNPRKVSFGSTYSIEYIYAADGRKLRTIYCRRVKNPTYSSLIMRGPEYYEFKDSTDYIGNLLLSDGKANMYRFQGGYYSFDVDNKLADCHYYIQDYQGNNRMVVNADKDSIEQITHYYPYGGIIGNLSSNQEAQKYKFEGKELDRSFGLDWYDIQARQYDAIVPVWNGIDQLAEKYYHISPYVMCAGNPVNLGDYDGKKLYYAPGTSDAFKKQFEATVKYMNSKGTSGNLAKLNASDNIYYIGENLTINGKRHGTHYNLKTKTININLSQGEGMKTTEGYLLSPATAIAHEAAHAVHDDTGELNDRRSEPDEEYGDKEERDVIMKEETKAARKHGEIENNEQTRYNHFGIPFQFKNPDGSTMTPEQIEDFCKQWNRGL